MKDLTSLEKAAKAVKEEGMSYRIAMKKFGVSTPSIRRKVQGQVKISTRNGPDPILTDEDEKSIAKKYLSCLKAGSRLTKSEQQECVRNLITEYLEEDRIVSDSFPSRIFIDNFLKKYKAIFDPIIKGVLIDLNGTLHVGNKAIEGSVKALELLGTLPNIQIRFVTNTTKKSRQALISQVQGLGFDSISPSNVFSSPVATIAYLKENELRPFLLIDPALSPDFKQLDCTNPNSVVIGLAPDEFNYDKLNEAFRLLLNGAPLIAMHKGKYFAGSDGLFLGPGAFVSALEYGSGVKSVTIGKPSKVFYQSVLNDMNIAAENAIMIGDDLMQDIEGPQKMGMQTILVRTGKYRKDDEKTIDTPPSFVADSIVDAVEWIKENRFQNLD